ncbi:MAG: hypothetical protein AB1689_28445, partial [Thermodesulfobacteriota bacterium]
MKRPPHGRGDDDRAALYALGALPPEQAAGFEERLRGAPALRAEVDALRAAASELAFAAQAVPPRPAVRERLLARVAAEPQPAAA